MGDGDFSREPEPSDDVAQPAVAPHAPAPTLASGRGMSPALLTAATALHLQRAAGNRAVAQMATAPARTLARCGGGGCTCGGRCKGHDDEDEFEEELDRRGLRSRVMRRIHERGVARASTPPPQRRLSRCSGGCSCGGRCKRREDEFDEIEALRRQRLSRSPTGRPAPPAVTQLSRCSCGGRTAGGCRCAHHDEDPLEGHERRRPGRVLSRVPQRRRRWPRRRGCAELRRNQGPGRFGTDDPSNYRDTIGVVGDRVFTLTNFDINAEFVKTEHRAHLRDFIAPRLSSLITNDNAFVAVVGEASTTGDVGNNQSLSDARAECVLAILREALGPQGERLFRPEGVGQTLAFRRRMAEDVENDDDRRVAIIPVDHRPPAPDQCGDEDKARSAQSFRVRAACKSGGQIAINIGTVGLAHPTFRRFRFVPDEGERCSYRIDNLDGTTVRAVRGMRLGFGSGINGPDGASDFSHGRAKIDPRFKRLYIADGEISVPGLEGTASTRACGRGGLILGHLYPDGPVECGEPPMPERDPRCDNRGPCSEADRTAAGSRFGARILGGSLEVPLDRLKDAVKRYVPGELHFLVDRFGADLTAFFTTITSLDTHPTLVRRFIFVGGEVMGGGDWNINAGVDRGATASQPMRLATDRPEERTAPSDFGSDVSTRTPRRANFTLKAHSAESELQVGDITFHLRRGICYDGPDRTVTGTLIPYTGAECDDIWLPWIPNRDCSEECPDERQLEGNNRFRIRVGRAAPANLPAIGNEFRDKLGCDTSAAFVNIGTRGDDPIYRRYLWIGHRGGGCGYDADHTSYDHDTLRSYRLSTEDPDDWRDDSDFHGLAMLATNGDLWIEPASLTPQNNFGIPGLPRAIPLPGSYRTENNTCAAARSFGVMVPISQVECGAVPDTPHQPGPDPDSRLDACRNAYATDPEFAPIAQQAVRELRAGAYNQILATSPPGRARLVYHRPLQSLAAFDPLRRIFVDPRSPTVVRHAVFAGRAKNGTPIVTIVDMEVLSYDDTSQHNGTTGPNDPTVRVRFVSEPCTFDFHGNPTYAQPRDCQEGLLHNGQEVTLEKFHFLTTTVPPGGRPTQQPQPARPATPVP